jgi:hypothetical protein
MRTAATGVFFALVVAAGCSPRAGADAGLTSAPAATPTVVVSASPVTSAASASASASAASLGTPSLAAGPLAGDAIKRDAAYLAGPELHGRASGSPDEARAAAWLATELDLAHADAPLGRVVPFTHGGTKSKNILAVVGPKPLAELPPGEVVVLGAHYDHLGVVGGATYWGAEDNASGAAVVLAVTRALVARRSELVRPVVVAFFGAEELGLFGSFELVKAWKFDRYPISTMVNVDMIGRSLVDQPGLWIAARALGVLSDVDPDHAVAALVPETNAPFVARVRAAAQAEGVRAVTIGDLPASLQASVLEMSRGRGDHYPFEKKGIPYVFFSSGESSDYHEPSDTADKLEPEILEARARVILRFVIECSARPG